MKTQTTQALALPEINGSACVHSLSVVASCSACIDACHFNALIMDDELFGIDEQACTGCGQCQPACMQNAISFTLSVPIRTDPDGKSSQEKTKQALLVCRNKNPDAELSCVHSQGIEQLASLYLKGVRQLLVMTEDCETCDLAGSATIDDHLDRFNQLAQSRQTDLLKIYRVKNIDWPKKPVLENASRRAFLRRAIPHSPEEPETNPPAALQQFLTPVDGDTQVMYPAFASIDATLCNGCDSCVNICPEDAIIITSDDDRSLSYRTIPQNCTGCNLCLDICDTGAINISHMSLYHIDPVSLMVNDCTICGTRFHVPQSGSANSQLCRICSKTDHHKKLFQVLE